MKIGWCGFDVERRGQFGQVLRVRNVGDAELAELARRIRLHVLRMTNRGGSSHVGAAFSMADIVAVLYGAVMNVNPWQPNDPARDRFLLSKGHAGAAVYAALAESGFLAKEK